VNLVLKVLEKAGIRINGFKYIFHAKEMKFLSFIVGLDKIKIDLKKNIGNLGLTNITKCDRGSKIYKICEFLSTIY
jgi:hypothetical protein